MNLTSHPGFSTKSEGSGDLGPGASFVLLGTRDSSPVPRETPHCLLHASPQPALIPPPTQNPGPILTSQTTGLRTLALAPAPGNLFCSYWQDCALILCPQREHPPQIKPCCPSPLPLQGLFLPEITQMFLAPVSNRQTHQVHSLLPEEKQSPHSRTRTQSVSFYYYCFILPFDMEQHAALWLCFFKQLESAAVS